VGPDAGVPAFELDEVTIDELQLGQSRGQYSARGLLTRYLERIETLDRAGPTLAHIIEVNPDAARIADELDAERAAGRVRGPLHGIPIVIKDNIATRDRMETTAGSLALIGSKPPRDALVVGRLRDAGAVILGKANLSEWANIRDPHSSSGWSARGGQGRNPYALDRSPSGSSSGTGGAVAANYCAVGIGTETDGSIVSPAAAMALVGIKPTVGLVSRDGIIPIAESQDTAGPMSRTVREDAAILLEGMVGRDPRDAATARARRQVAADYVACLQPDGLRGARVGIAREGFFGYSAHADGLAEAAIDVLRGEGATVIDPADVPNVGRYRESEFEVLLFEFKAGLNAYLADLESSPVRSLGDVIAFNEEHAAEELALFGQEFLINAEAKEPLSEPAYRAARAKNRRLSRRLGIDAVLGKHRLDALVAPTQGPAWLVDHVNGDLMDGSSTSTPAAVAGYPHITVPMGFAKGLPVGLSFVGAAWSEPTLLRLAFAFEHATQVRRPPDFSPSAG
jgi:amidase